MPSRTGGCQVRVSSPPGPSTLTTSAPMSASSIVAYGPARIREKSAMRTIVHDRRTDQPRPAKVTVKAGHQVGGLTAVPPLADSGNGYAERSYSGRLSVESGRWFHREMPGGFDDESRPGSSGAPGSAARRHG